MNEKSILSLLLKLLNEFYEYSKEDRHKLHLLEWKDNINSPSILGEAEIRNSTIAGLVITHINKGKSRYSKDEVLIMLEKCGVYNSPILVKWILNESGKYRNFATYLHNLEHLRLVFSEIIRGIDDCDGSKYV